MLPQASLRGNIQGKLKPEKPNASDADLHPELRKGRKEVLPESSWKHKKQHADIKANEEDELVRYMSNLPSYLERGANPQEKLLNVGVLDWGRLEKWQGSHKQILHRSSISSLCSSNTSSLFSTDESSAHSSRGHSCSPARQRLQRPSLQSHLMPVPTEGHLPFVKPFRGNVGKFQDLKSAHSNNFTVQGKFIREDKSFCKDNAKIKLEQCKRREMHPKIDSECGTVPNGIKDSVASCDKVKMKNQVGESMKKGEKFQEVIPTGANQDATEERNTGVLLPTDLPKTNHSGPANLSDLTTKSSKKEAEPSQRTFLEIFKAAHHAKLSSNFHHSGPLPCKLDGSKHLQRKSMGSIDANSNDFTSERSRSVPRGAKIENNYSRSRNLEEKKLNATPAVIAANEAYKGSDPKGSKDAVKKVRSTSPFRRFSFSMGKADKSSGPKEGSSMPQVSSTCSSAKTDPENPVASGVDTCADKLDARARSSPLRRLLDPLLKPKAVNCRNFTNQLQGSLLTESSCKSSERPRHSTVTVQSTKVKSDTISHCTINVNDSAQNKKCGSSAVQALLRVQVKNGLPLFTFAVDNHNNILAATVKTLSASGKGDYGCVYTFFAIQEVRKKNGRWINQGRKGRSQDYVPNVVAQMKVSGSEFSHLSRPNHVDQFSIREFVLLALDVGQENRQASDFQPNDEQAAIVVKIPKRNKNSIRDVYLIDKHNNLPQATLKACLPEVKLELNSGKNVPFVGELNSGKKVPFVGVQDISATVILPSGVHSLPNKGEPSSLIQRWKSGGTCDCGGWDLGCELRILSSKSQFSQQSSSLKGSSISNQFELFFQGGVQDKQHFFSLAPFRDGIYSVEFNSSLSHMQAFSICIAVWDSRKHCELSESSVTSSEERTSAETIPNANDRITAPNPIDGEPPARYVSYPPVSPVGRV